MADKPLWQWYKVRLDFTTSLCGSVPGDPELIKAWLEAREPSVKPPSGKSIDQIQEEVFATLPQAQEDIEQFSLLIFQRDNNNGGNLVVRAATIRAHLKDCARVLSSLYIGKIEGEKAFSTKVLNGVYPDESKYWIPIIRPDGKHIFQADGTKDKPVHARGPRGQPINALKRIEWIEPASIEFTLKVLGGCVSEKDLGTLFTYGGTHGYAGERSDGEGKYTFKLEHIEE